MNAIRVLSWDGSGDKKKNEGKNDSQHYTVVRSHKFSFRSCVLITNF